MLNRPAIAAQTQHDMKENNVRVNSAAAAGALVALFNFIIHANDWRVLNAKITSI